MKKNILILVLFSLVSCNDEDFRLSKLSLKLEKSIYDLEYHNKSKFHVFITEARTNETYETYMNYEDIAEFNLPNGHYDIIVENVSCFEGQYFFYNMVDKVISSDELVRIVLEVNSCFEEKD